MREGLLLGCGVCCKPGWRIWEFGRRGGGGKYGRCKTFVVRGIMLCVCALESLTDINA